MSKKFLNREKYKYEIERGTIPRHEGHINKVLVILRLSKSCYSVLPKLVPSQRDVLRFLHCRQINNQIWPFGTASGRTT